MQAQLLSDLLRLRADTSSGTEGHPTPSSSFSSLSALASVCQSVSALVHNYLGGEGASALGLDHHLTAHTRLRYY